jgi:ribosomal protein S18 acetylase RimI-like enzyme
MQTSIRNAVAADALEVAEIHLAARREMTYLPVLHSDEETRSWMAGEVFADCRVAVAEIGGAVVGFAALEGGRLEHLYVHPDFQSQGVGALLLAWSLSASPGGVDLWVYQKNLRAIAFYRRHGFSEVRRTDGENEEREPDLLLAWSSASDTMSS